MQLGMIGWGMSDSNMIGLSTAVLSMAVPSKAVRVMPVANLAGRFETSDCKGSI
jgi:hypothetical protein